MKTIITPTDFSSSSLNAVRYAADMTLSVQGRLLIFHALPRKVEDADDLDLGLENETAEKATRKMDKLLAEIKAWTRYQVKVEGTIEYGNIVNILRNTCYEAPPFAIVMAASEKNAIERLVFGSETLSVSRKIHAPIIFVPLGCCFNGFSKVAVASNLQNVAETIPLEELTEWLEVFEPALHIVTVKKEEQYRNETVSEAVALQTHFEKRHPLFRYIDNGDVVAGINEYVTDEHPDLLIVFPQQQKFFQKSISHHFTLRPSVPTMILSAQDD